jgi:iron complex outermembrane receptor protein
VRRLATRGLRALGGALLLGVPPGAPLPGQGSRDSVRVDSLARRIAPVVVTAAPYRTTPGGSAVVVVDPTALRGTAAPSLDEVLRQVPFVLVRQNSRGETELSVRGSDSRQVAVLLDGLPLTLGWDHRADASLVPAAGVRSIRVARGSSSLLDGPNVLGGVVELELGAPATGRAPSRTLGISTDVDAHGATTASLVAGGSIRATARSTLSARIGAGHRARDGVPRARGVADLGRAGDLLLNTQLRQHDAFASLRWRTGSGAHAGATVSGYRSSRGVAPERHIAEPRFWTYPSQARLLGIVSAGTGPRATPFGHGALDLSTGYSRGRLEINEFSDASYSTLDRREWGDERLHSLHLRGSHALPFDGRLRVAITGGRVEYLETLDAPPAAYYRQNLWSTGAEVELPVARRLSVSGGLVSDASSTPATGGREPLGRLSRRGWRAGLSTTAPGDRIRIHAGVSERSRLPSLRELYSGALDRFAPNPELEPETLFAGEVGVSFAGAPAGEHGVRVQVVGFRHVLDDAVVRTVLEDGRLMRRNRDEIRTTGAELSASFVPSTRGPWASGDVVVQDIRVRDKTVAGGARRAEHQPAIRGGIEIGAPLPLRAESAVSVRFTGAQHCLNSDLARLQRLGGTGVAGVELRREWWLVGGPALVRRLTAALWLDNIADRAVYDQCGLPRPGRTLRLRLVLHSGSP